MKWGRPRDVGEKEIVAPYKKFNAFEKGHRPQLREEENMGSGT